MMQLMNSVVPAQWGRDGRVVMQWLAETIAGVVEQNIPGADDRLAPTALCMPLAKKSHSNL